MGFAFQLYSSRNSASQAAFLSTLAGLGYTAVEGYGGVYTDPQGFAAALAEAGLAMPSGHFALEDLRADFDAVMDLTGVLGVHHVVVPYLAEADRPGDVAGWQALGGELEALAQKARAAGKALSYHNHDFEFVALEDGSLPMEILLQAAPSMGWEADLAWVVRAGLDPAVYVERHADRLIGVHVKDIAAAGTCEAEDGWADIGTGTMPWAALKAQVARQAPQAALIAEHDNPSDPERFARVSIQNLQEL